MLLLITSATIYEESKEKCISIKAYQLTYRYYNKRVVIIYPHIITNKDLYARCEVIHHFLIELQDPDGKCLDSS